MAKATKMTFCSFCGKSQNEVRKIIAGPEGVYICDSCVAVCKTIIDRDVQEGDEGDTKAEATFKLAKPAALRKSLDAHIIGQDHAKKVLSVAVYNHYKRLMMEAGGAVDEEQREAVARWKDIKVEKSNILLIGPTGSGKTLLARTLADLLEVPFAIADATTLTEAGYVGEDVENIVLRLVQAANYDLKKAECGIIYVDEIDKIGRKTDNVSITRDVSGEGVQQALLKILEGTICNIPPQGGRKHPNQEYLQLDTSRILFICGGAFVGLEQIIQQRSGVKVLGFEGSAANDKAAVDSKAEGASILRDVQPEDLVSYGMIPEFIGRLPMVSVLNPLSQSDLEHILVDTDNALVKQYSKLFAMEGAQLRFTRDAIAAIATKALELKTGARALRAIMEELMLDVMYELPEQTDVKEVVINRAAVEGRRKPVLKRVSKTSAAQTAAAKKTAAA